ncbi:TPA: polyphosphate kinase, partial [Yersinia enterocolitica]
MLSKDKLKYPTEITDEQLRYLITAFENKMTEFHPVGREAEIARQLLSLREQLAELKALEPVAEMRTWPKNISGPNPDWFWFGKQDFPVGTQLFTAA